MIPDPKFNIWEHTRETLFDLYARRARRELPEMTCHRQAVEIFLSDYRPGFEVLDAGCATGYLYWSFFHRRLEVQYHGLDYTRSFIEIGRQCLPPELVPPKRLEWGAMEDLSGSYDAVFCINTLHCLPDYHQGLERLAQAARSLLIVRTALDDRALIRYETDDYLDEGFRGPGGLRSYFNIWAIDEVIAFIAGLGFSVTRVRDERTGDQPELSAGKVFPWKFLVCRRNGGR
ncbi:MAG: class I SAM-dependent methyltransferase [Thermodesulfobacteriota bacterium]